jgi:hypothetical protein
MRALASKSVTAFNGLILLLALTGCTSMQYSEYFGHDSTSVFGTWQTSSGTMAEQRAVPVYRGWPDRAYKVIGSLRLSNPAQTWDEGDFAAAARRAKHRGGDAIIIRQGSEFGVSKIAGAKNERWILSSSYTSALVIRWLSQKEIDDMDGTVEQIIHDHNKFANPDRTMNHELQRLLIAYLYRSGADIHSRDFSQRFDESVAKIKALNPERIEGNWFYKVVLSSGTAISGDEERDYYGIATFSTNGDSATLVSSEGELEINFNGVLGKGTLNGQLGLGSYAAKTEGAVTPNKISFSFQSRSSDGIVRGNMVLQR